MEQREDISADKLRGGYYTPEGIADFLVNWGMEISPSHILEPSCGDGVFIKALHKYGLTDILTSIRNIDSPIHLSFDVDSIDPTYFASTGTPVENGLKLNDIYNIIERLKGHIVSADIVEFNPYLSNNITKQREAMYIANYINCLL